ncbi:RWD domain-containing protein [Meloidogyne graminicola]|nr:RWD domain-containing protein [Meloidogyne graminicola]
MDSEHFDESVLFELESIQAIFPKEVFIESNSKILVVCAEDVHLTINLALNYPK